MSSKFKQIKGEKIVYSIEFIEKKSKFISYVCKVYTVEEANEFILSIKKKHYDANHNCSAFIVGENYDNLRASDDGEPTGTAGKPMLDTLLGSEITNICVVITRYFGGIKLGPGGLVKAYQKGTSLALTTFEVEEKVEGVLAECIVTYKQIGAVLNEIEKNDIILKNSNYAENIKLQVLLTIDEVDLFKKYITEVSNGNSELVIISNVYFVK